MATWTFIYHFGGEEWFEEEIEITENEESIINKALKEGKCLDDMWELADLKERAYKQVEESFEDDDFDFDPCEDLVVYLQNPMKEC